MSDSFVQVAPDGTGKQIDAQTLVSALLATVYRQTVTLGDPNAVGAVQSVTPDGKAVVADLDAIALLTAAVQELACIRMALNSLANTQFTPSQVDITNRS